MAQSRSLDHELRRNRHGERERNRNREQPQMIFTERLTLTEAIAVSGIGR